MERFIDMEILFFIHLEFKKKNYFEKLNSFFCFK